VRIVGDSSNYQHLDTIKEVKKEKKQRKKEGMKRRDEGSYVEREGGTELPLIAPSYLGEGCHASCQPSDGSKLLYRHREYRRVPVGYRTQHFHSYNCHKLTIKRS